MHIFYNLYQLAVGANEKWTRNEQFDYSEAIDLVASCKLIPKEKLTNMPEIQTIIEYSDKKENCDSGYVANWPSIIQADLIKTGRQYGCRENGDNWEIFYELVTGEAEWVGFVASRFFAETIVSSLNNEMFDVLQSDIYKNYLNQCIESVKVCAEKASVSPNGFEIDNTFCDCGEIETSDVVDIIDEAGGVFGRCGSKNYSFIVDALCEDITEHFSKKEEGAPISLQAGGT